MPIVGYGGIVGLLSAIHVILDFVLGGELTIAIGPTGPVSLGGLLQPKGPTGTHK